MECIAGVHVERRGSSRFPLQVSVWDRDVSVMDNLMCEVKDERAAACLCQVHL